MESLIAAVIIVALLVVFEVKSHKHAKPVRENLQAVRDMKAVAKPYRRPEEQHG